MSKIIPKILYGSWGLLGFYRGTQYYDFYHEQEIQKRLNDRDLNDRDLNDRDFYSNKIGAGAFGTVAYILPFFCVFPLIKEMHRLEINLYGLEEEKKKPEYYSLF